MANFMTVTEARTWFSHKLTTPTTVVSGEEIAELTTIINNADVSLINIATAFADAGKLYYVDANGNKTYLTDPNNDYPAKYTILATFFLKKGETVSLRYSVDTTMHHLYVSHCAGVF